MSLPFRQSLNLDEVCLCCSVSPAFANVSQESDPKPRDAYIDELLKEPLHYRVGKDKDTANVVPKQATSGAEESAELT